MVADAGGGEGGGVGLVDAALQEEVAGSRGLLVCEEFEGGGFARAVGAEQTQDLVVAHRKGDRFQGLFAVVDFGDLVQPNVLWASCERLFLEDSSINFELHTSK